MAVPITSPAPTTVIGSLQKRQPIQAPVETHRPILEVMADNATETLHERASVGTGFDSLLCAALKALKNINPTAFSGLLQSCTSMIDSSSQGRKKTLKERNVNGKKDLATDAQAIDEVFGEAILGRSETDLLEKRGLSIENTREKRQDEGLDNFLARF